METDFDKVKDQEMDHKLILNPGPSYILKGSDFCFYLSKVKEEHTRLIPPEKSSKDEEKLKKKQQQREKNYGRRQWGIGWLDWNGGDVYVWLKFLIWLCEM